MRISTICMLIAALVATSVSSVAQEKKSPPPEFAKICGVDVNRAADGIFGKVRGKAWTKYANLKAAPAVNKETRSVAQYWHGEHASLVQVVNYGEGYARYHEYCFDADGKLSRLGFEMRSTAGWGFAQTNSVSPKGRLLPIASRFFDLRSQRTIDRPNTADDEPWMLNPDVYKRFDKLPFVKLISMPVEQKKENAQAH